MWLYAPVSLVPFVQRIRDGRTELKQNDSYPQNLRAQFNNFRIGLLEQVTGARFLENNSDLGEEVERILTQYLQRRLGNSVRIVRGGHIYDYDGNRSDQIDIIITPANALGFCPADTGDGKYNVMIDQVIAAISVTSRLTPERFRERMEGLQKTPQFQQKAKTYPGLKDTIWPLSYVVGAECDDFAAIHKLWDEIGDGDKAPEMVLLLDSGYIIKQTYLLPPEEGGRPERHVQFSRRDGIHAGLGLAWLEIQIAVRNWWMTNQQAVWLTPLQEQLRKLETSEPIIHDPKREPMFWWGADPIHGVIRGGRSGRWAHNRLFVTTILVGKEDSVTAATLKDLSRPIPKTPFFEYGFEPRWFKLDAREVNGDYCALEEWVDPQDPEKHQRQISVFDSRTGEDVTTRLSRPLSDCSAIKQLNPVLKE
jgi:hypothetical protein